MNKFTKKLCYFMFSIMIMAVFSSCVKKNSKKYQEINIVDTQSLINNIINSKEESEQVNKIVKKDVVEEKDNKNSKHPNDSEKTHKKNDKGKSKKTSKRNIKIIKIKAFGDIMGHIDQTIYAQNKGDGEYDFSDQFLYIKDFVRDADIAIGNYEATSNPNLEPSGFPQFNLPISYPKHIKDAGFDILTTANNHSLDTGEEGIFATIDAMEDAGVEHVGTQKEDESRILYKTVNDIKVAFLAYTYGANGLEWSVENYDVNKILNSLDEELIEKDIKIAKNNNADFIVVYPHWGIEYESYPSAEQIELGRKMIDWGADLVIGNHPHVVQPAEYYDTEDLRRGFIAYSLGNFISSQNLEGVGDIRTEQSVAYEIILSKDIEHDFTSIDNVKAYPLWVGTTYNDYGRKVQTYLATDFLGDGKFANEVDQYQKERIRQAQDMVNETVLTEIE